MTRSAPPPPSFDQELKRARAEFAAPEDLIRFLSAGPAAKLMAIRGVADLKAAMVMPLYDVMKGIAAEKRKLRARLESFSREGMDDAKPEVIALRERIAALTLEYDRAIAERNAMKAVAEAARHLVHRAENFIRSAQSLDPADDERALVKRGETHADALLRVRAFVEELRDRIEAALDAPLPAAEAIAVATAAIDKLAARGRPDVSKTIDEGKDPEFVMDGSTFRAGAGNLVAFNGDRVQFDALALLAWATRDQMVAALEKEIREKSRDGDALSASEREATIAQLRAELLAAERQEEAVITAAAAIGHQLDRRRDADIRAVLGLVDDAGGRA